MSGPGPCQRPDCEGSYEDVGGGELYCDTCGLAPVVSSTGMLTATRTGMTNGGSTGTGGGGAPPGDPGGEGPSGRSGRSGSPEPSGSRGSQGSGGSSGSPRSGSGRLSSRSDGSGRSVSVRSSGNSGSATVPGRLGVGLVSIPDIPRPDPRSAVMARPELPERKRFCSRSGCGAPVGRSRGDRPGRTEGFCTQCGHPYSFLPKLRAGDVVHGQYEVAGCLAHGGLGWIYLAVDRAVGNRWVVLKGLLDSGDGDAMAAAISERQFLAQIEHPNIVDIYNFVEHLDQRTGSLDGYIVMEYVGGKSLKEIANERRDPGSGKRDPLPVEQACAYGIEALGALGYLHSRKLLYCDFKVDNAIQTEDRLILIDMGAVRRADDDESAIYGTVGYQAPEITDSGPSVASDLYTVARALAVLTFDFQGYTTIYAQSLPSPEDVEVFRRYESFHRLLVRATDPDPARRFSSAQEMADQLTGVLREVVALQTNAPRPALSTLFGPEMRVTDTRLFADLTDDVSLLGAVRAAARGGPARRPWRRALRAAGPERGTQAGTPASAGSSGGRLPVAAGPGPRGPVPAPRAEGAFGPPVPVAQDVSSPLDAGRRPGDGAGAPTAVDKRATALALPVPRVDPGDPNAGFLAGLLTSAAPDELIAALDRAPVESAERRIRQIRAWLESGEPAPALAALTTLDELYPDDWRVVWYRGLASLVTGDNATAAESFDAVYDAFPGETAPKLALGVCAEVLGRLDNAAGYYRLVWTTDPSYVSAAFGLARVQLAVGARAEAVRSLESVPESSIHYTAARVACVRARLRHRTPGEPLLDDLRMAAVQVEALHRLGLDAVRREQLSAEVLGTALDWVLSGSQGGAADPSTTLLGSKLDERGLRFGLERSYRALARLAQHGEERIELVERANRFRPRTWV